MWWEQNSLKPLGGLALVLFILSLSSSQRTLLLEIPVKYVTLWVSYQLSRTILRSLSKEWWTWMPVKHLWETQTDSLGGHSPAKQDSCSVGVCSNCTEQQGQSSVGSCHQPLWSQGHSHSVINTGSSHFLKWLHLETISGSLLPFHHETRTCNRFFPWSVFFSSLLSLFGHSLYQSDSAGHKRRWLHLWCLDLLYLCFVIVMPMLGALAVFSPEFSLDLTAKEMYIK